MSAKWNDDYNYNELITKINNSKTIKPDGSVAFLGFEFSQLHSMLYSMLCFSEYLPETEKRRIIWQAVLSTDKKVAISAKGLLIEINKITNGYLQKPLIRYILVTTLSIRPETKLKRIRFRGVTISFLKTLNSKLRKSRSEVERISQSSLTTEIPNNYIFTKVSVLARSVDEAVDKGLNALDTIRGTWNWLENRRHYFRMTFGTRKPVNKIILGPLHTLHFPNGELATEGWWYEAKRFSNLEPSSITQDVENLYIFQKKVRKNLAICKYAQEIERAIIIYTRALDEWDWDGAFLKLWGVLEQLTNTDNYKETIRRASFIFSDRIFYQQILRHLKDYRNKYVHEAAENSEIETYIYQLKNFVEQLLSFHLGNKYRFNSIKEASEFLDIPSDKKELSYRIKLMKYAQKYHNQI